MSVLNISAVDPATDQLTITGHGLTTGDGPGTMFTPGGTIPGGLASNTDTWVIRVDADHIKLATSNANALAGTALNITSAGSGTLQLLVGIPYRRARTYGAGSQLKSADLNGMQDALAALFSYLTGQAQSIWSSGTKTINRPVKSPECYTTSGSFSNVPPGGVLGASSTVYIPLPDLPKNCRLLAVRLYYGSNADAAACTAKLYATADAVPCVAGFTDLSRFLTAGGTSIASASGLSFQYANAGSYWVQVTNTTGGERVSAVGIDYDIP